VATKKVFVPGTRVKVSWYSEHVSHAGLIEAYQETICDCAFHVDKFL
jgi:hypothetical protein